MSGDQGLKITVGQWTSMSDQDDIFVWTNYWFAGHFEKIHFQGFNKN